MIGRDRSQKLARNTTKWSNWLGEVVELGCDWMAGTSLEQQSWSITVGIA